MSNVLDGATTSKSESVETKSESESETRVKMGKRFGRGAVESGLTHECGVFGVVATGTNVSVLRIDFQEGLSIITSFQG